MIKYMNFNVNCEVLNVIFFKLLFKKFLIIFTVIIIFIFLLKKLYNKFAVINCLVILLFKKQRNLGRNCKFMSVKHKLSQRERERERERIFVQEFLWVMWQMAVLKAEKPVHFPMPALVQIKDWANLEGLVMLACLGYVTNSSPKPNLCLIGSLFTKEIIYHNAKYARRVKYMSLSQFSVAG